MDALTRHRMLLLAGVPVSAMRVPAPVEVRDQTMGYDDEDVEEQNEGVLEDDDEDLDDEAEDDDLDEEDDQSEDDHAAAARDRQLRMLGIELRAKSNPAPGRQVLTPAGSKRFKLPIGATILPGGQVLLRGVTMSREAATDVFRRENPDVAVPAKKAAKAAPAKAAKKATASVETRLRRARSDEAAMDAAPVKLDETSRTPKMRGLEDLPPEQQQFIAEQLALFGARGSVPVNMRLRGLSTGELHMTTAQIDELQRGLDEAFEQAALNDDVVTWRGFSGREVFGENPRDWPEDLTGITWTEPGYASTTAKREVGETFRRERDGVLARVLLPEGSSVIEITPFGSEAELLMSRGWTFRVVADHGSVPVTNPNMSGVVRLIDVEAIPPVAAAPRLAPAQATKATPRKAPAKAPAFDPAEVAGRISSQKTEADVVRLLSADQSLTAAKLRKVAEYLGIEVPDNVRAKTSLQLLIAEHEANERDLPGGFDATSTLSVDPAVRAVQVENRIRQAYDAAPKLAGGGTTLTQLRPLLADLPRDEVDAALIRIGREPTSSLLPNEDRVAMTDVDREAAITDGGTRYWFVEIGDTTPRPVPSASAPDDGGRGRLARVQAAQSTADTIAEIDQLIDNGNSQQVFDSRIQSATTRGGLTQEQAFRLTAAVQSGDRDRIQAEVDAIASAAGLERVTGRAGEIEPYDPTRHGNIGAGDLRGKMVRIVRPGYTAPGIERNPWDERPGPLVVLKAAVEEATPDEAASAVEAQAVQRHGTAEPAGLRQERHAQAIEALPDDTSAQAYYQALQQVPDGDLVAVARYLGARFRAGLTDPDARRRNLAEQLRPGQVVAAPVVAPAEGGDLSRMTVPQLRARAAALGIRIPSGARKADIIRLLGGTPTTAAQRSRMLALLGVEERADAPGNDLKRYWTKDPEGLAKWVGKPHPWTALRNHLRKHVGQERANRIASEWFHDVFGIWPGERKGENPVGPG